MNDMELIEMVFGPTMKEMKCKKFANGAVYALETGDGFPVEVTDTFLPFYTKNSAGGDNKLKSNDFGSRSERWMIGVSCMSGCPVGCKFCATGNLKKWRNLTAAEIVKQVDFILDKNVTYYYDIEQVGGDIFKPTIIPTDPEDAKEFKINYTRMGEPFLNIDNVREAMRQITERFPDTHHYISTVGLKGSDFSWIEGNTTLQISLHSLDEERRHDLIPINNLMSIEELGQIRTNSNLKTTVNLTLVDEADFDIEVLKKYFDPKYFFIKLSPINVNAVSEKNHMGEGIIKARNLR